MSWLNEAARRAHAFVFRSRLERELDAEMRLHIELRQAQLEAGTLPADEARIVARRRFGNVAVVKEDAMEAWGWRWLAQLVQDVRIGVRTLVRHPGFALMAILTLGLGIGASAAIFTVVNGVILRPLPFREPSRLVRITGTSPLEPLGGTALPNVVEYRLKTTSLESIAGAEFSARFLRAGDEPERVFTVMTERDFFKVLGVAPLRGRTFDANDPATVAVITERYWIRRFGSDPSVVGTSVLLDDQPYTVIGVMPASFEYPYRVGSLSGTAAEGPMDMWIPLAATLNPRSRIGGVTARLKPGVTLAAAQSEMSGIALALAAAYPDTNTGRGVRLEPLQAAIVPSSIRQPLYMLFVAVGLVLALACANVANLSLVRVTLRSREVAVRSALGASRMRLVRQFLTESLVLSFAGGAVGLALGWWGARQLVDLVGLRIPRVSEVGFNWQVFAFLLAVCTLTGVVIGLAPALLAGRRDARSVLQEGGGHSTMAPGSRRLRDGLAVVEVALAFVLAVASALLIRELVRLESTDSGMVTANAMTFHLGQRRTPETPREVYEIASRVSALSGVRAAGVIQLLPLQNSGWSSNSSDFRLRGTPPQTPVYPIELRYVTPGYFKALGIPIRQGRAFTDQDDAQATPVVLINETLAKRAFPGQDPVGKETTRGVVAGVVGDVRQDHLDRAAAPEIYYPIAQNWSQLPQHGLTLIVSAQDRPEPLTDVVRRVVREVNPNFAIFRVKTMDEVVGESLSGFRLYLLFIAAAAAVALVLAVIGTYGVVSYIAASRTREFAIRVALGADTTRVARLVVRDGLRLTVAGVGLGLIGAMAARGFLQGLPIAVRPPDLTTIVPTAVVIAAVAMLACLAPGLRAAGVDPTKSLRSE